MGHILRFLFGVLILFKNEQLLSVSDVTSRKNASKLSRETIKLQ